MPWPWQRRQSRPFGPDFTIKPVSVLDPAADAPAIHTLPFNEYAQLTAVTFDITLGALASEHHANIIGTRGSSILYVCRCHSPLSDVGTHHSSLMLGLGVAFLRNKAHWQSDRLGDYFYLYPHDTVLIEATSSAALNYQLSNVQLTFKLWEVV